MTSAQPLVRRGTVAVQRRALPVGGRAAAVLQALHAQRRIGATKPIMQGLRSARRRAGCACAAACVDGCRVGLDGLLVRRCDSTSPLVIACPTTQKGGAEWKGGLVQPSLWPGEGSGCKQG